MAVVSAPTRVAAQWRAARRLYPVYAALALHFKLGTPPFGEDLRAAESQSEPEVISTVETWLAEMDERIQAHQLRHVLQASDVARTEQKLHALAERYIAKPKKTDADRDKVDFLLAHYFAVCAPPSFHDREIDLQDVAEVLEPLLGECSYSLPPWLEPLEAIIRELPALTSLLELKERQVIGRGRQLKAACGELYFAGNTLIAFTRFNYLINRTQKRLLLRDVEAAEKALLDLQQQGITTADCRAAQMEAEQPLDSVATILVNIRTRLPGEYGLDDSMTRSTLLRAALEAAVRQRGAGMVTGGDARIKQLEARVDMLQKQVEMLRMQLERGGAAPRPAAATPTPIPQPAPVPPTPAPQPQAAAPEPQLAVTVDIKDEELTEALNDAASTASVPTPPVAPETQPTAPPATATQPAGNYPTIEATVAKLQEELNQAQGGKRRSGAATIRVTGTVLPLSEPEMNAFLDPATDDEGLLRRSVAARILVVDAIERSKLGNGNGVVKHALTTGEEELQRVAKAIQESRNAQRLETANALTAAHRQLSLVLQRARAAARA